MKVRDYKDLLVWQKGIEIVDQIYEFTKSFPSEELFGLSTQLRRAAVSIPSNIAEGFARQHSKEYIQFLYVALSSCAELETQIIISFHRQYIPSSQYESFLGVLNHEMRMLRNLIKSL